MHSVLSHQIHVNRLPSNRKQDHMAINPGDSPHIHMQPYFSPTCILLSNICSLNIKYMLVFKWFVSYRFLILSSILKYTKIGFLMEPLL